MLESSYCHLTRGFFVSLISEGYEQEVYDDIAGQGNKNYSLEYRS